MTTVINNAPIVTGFFTINDLMVTSEGTIGFLSDSDGEATLAFTAKQGEFSIGSEVYLKARLSGGDTPTLTILESRVVGAIATPTPAPVITLDEAKAIVNADKREKAALAKANKERKHTPELVATPDTLAW